METDRPDAFNGKLLWKRDIPTWITQLANFRAGPAQMPRRLVSVGDRVFVTLGLDAPVEMLDAVTGKTLHSFPGSAKTEEIIVHEGMLLAAVGDPNVLTDAVSKVDGFWQIEARDVKQVRRQILAYDLESGEEVWRVDDDTAAGYTGLSLTAHQDQRLLSRWKAVAVPRTPVWQGALANGLPFPGVLSAELHADRGCP